MNLPPVTSRAFLAMQNLNIPELATIDNEREIRPFLPSLVRMSLLSPLDTTVTSMDSRKQILALLVGIEVVNNIVALLQVNYHELEIDVKKEQQLRQKIGTGQQDNSQFNGLQNGIALGFERADVTRKVHVVLSELFYIQSLVNEMNMNGGSNGSSSSRQNEGLIKQSELFDNEIYLEEITDIICIALAELPSLLSVQELVDTLLYVNNGPAVICWVVANVPDCYRDVIYSLVSTADEDTADGKLKLNVLNALSEINPNQALGTRSLCVDLMKMPSLMLKLSLKDPQDLIAFTSGLLLGNDQNVRSWFALFIRTNQKRKGDALQLFREELVKQLQSLVAQSHNSRIPERSTVQAVALLRLYCALKGIGGIKFSDEELHLIMQLITTKPAPTPAGIRFVSLGLCMLIACPSLILNSQLESKAVEWMQWLVKEEAYFESKSGVTGSFGEMLLLMAIHFHSNQISAIAELVCSTLVMKIPIRQNNTTKMKQIFTQDLFTEQTVAAHAVKVPVTSHLNANIPGYLPVHCIHQLLKSRAFSKHKVTIKSWILKQITNCSTPLHPVMPALIEVYVNSLILPHSQNANIPNVGAPGIVAAAVAAASAEKGKSSDHLHKPLSENEILKVFRSSVVGIHLDNKKRVYSVDALHESSMIDACLVVGSVELKVDPRIMAGSSDFLYEYAEHGSAGNVSTVTAQLLILYYLVLYEDVRLANMANIISNGRKVKAYSTEFLSELPIKYLLQQAQKNQHEYAGLFHPLLRLLITHFPHLSLVEDWIEEDSVLSSLVNAVRFARIQDHQLAEAFDDMHSCPSKIIKYLRLMLKKPPTDIWGLSHIFVANFKKILDIQVPRLIQELYRKVWMRLNTVLPRRLWTITINALMPADAIFSKFSLTHENLLLDPLHVLRCDERVFRCPDALIIVLRILQASLAASKSQLTRHTQDKPVLDKHGQLHNEMERDELKTALVACQESSAVQILLEACLEDHTDEKIGRKWALREIRSIVCSYIHQVFISEPSLAKLVHFQTYPRELLSTTVRGIPSMHICLDFLIEILSTPEMEKQIFVIDLTSHLISQYALPKSLGITKCVMNTLTTLLGLLTADCRVIFFRSILPCIIRFAKTFPLILDDIVTFLIQLGRISHSQSSLGLSAIPYPIVSLQTGSKTRAKAVRTLQATNLFDEVKETFSKILDETILNPKIY